VSLPPPKARFSICVIADDANRLLFLKRAPHLKLGPGQWGFPAGHIEDGETPAACALREMDEEIGTARELDFVRALGPVRDTWFGGQYEVHLFHYRWRGGRVELNDEHTAYAWIAPADYTALDVMAGIDEDLLLLEVWPYEVLNPARLPPSLRR
jgi:8-oxo-dGTP diphosphatase